MKRAEKAALQLYISNMQVENFLPNVDTQMAEDYTVYECAETPGIYFLGCGTVNAHTQPFEDLAQVGDDFVRLISCEKAQLITELFQYREVEYV